jgi:hypothetical protein
MSNILGSWFSSRSSESVNKDVDSVRRSLDAVRADDLPPPNPPLPQFVPNPTTFSTPHDDVLAGLYGLRQDADASLQLNTAAAPTISVGDVLKKDDGNDPASLVESTGPGLLARDTTPYKQTQELRDPFSGALLGTLVPFTQEDDEEDEVGMDAKEQELWAHHSKIMELQSELALMHMEMEGIAAKSDESRRKNTKRTSGGWGGEDGDGADEDEEAAANKAREEEFEALAGKFTGRRDAIDGIMNKVSLRRYCTLVMPKRFTSSSMNCLIHYLPSMLCECPIFILVSP